MALTYALVATKADPITKEQSCKRGTVDASSAGGIKMIFVVLGPFSLACGFGTTGLSLKDKIHAKHCPRPNVFLVVLDGSYGKDWTSCIAWCETPYSKESPRASGLLYPAQRGGGESRVPSLRSLETF